MCENQNPIFKTQCAVPQRKYANAANPSKNDHVHNIIKLDKKIHFSILAVSRPLGWETCGTKVWDDSERVDEKVKSRWLIVITGKMTKCSRKWFLIVKTKVVTSENIV